MLESRLASVFIELEVPLPVPLATGGGANGFGEVVSKGLATSDDNSGDDGLDLSGVGGVVGFGGGAFSIDLPCLNKWNIPANTSIIMPTMKSE